MLPKTGAVPDEATAGLPSVAVRMPSAYPLSPPDPPCRRAPGRAERQSVRLRQPHNRGPRQDGPGLEGAPHPRRRPLQDRPGIHDHRPARSRPARAPAARRRHPRAARPRARDAGRRVPPAGPRGPRAGCARPYEAPLQPANAPHPPREADAGWPYAGTGRRVAFPLKAPRRPGQAGRERVLAGRDGRPAARGPAAVRHAPQPGRGRIPADPRRAPRRRRHRRGPPRHRLARASSARVSGPRRPAPAAAARSGRPSRRSRGHTRAGRTSPRA